LHQGLIRRDFIVPGVLGHSSSSMLTGLMNGCRAGTRRLGRLGSMRKASTDSSRSLPSLVCRWGREISEATDNPLVGHAKPCLHIRPIWLRQPSCCQVDDENAFAVGLPSAVIRRDVQPPPSLGEGLDLGLPGGTGRVGRRRFLFACR
jgi:hypothetical protein